LGELGPRWVYAEAHIPLPHIYTSSNILRGF
jgi:hypothetical protein